MYDWEELPEAARLASDEHRTDGLFMLRLPPIRLEVPGRCRVALDVQPQAATFGVWGPKHPLTLSGGDAPLAALFHLSGLLQRFAGGSAEAWARDHLLNVEGATAELVPANLAGLPAVRIRLRTEREGERHYVLARGGWLLHVQVSPPLGADPDVIALSQELAALLLATVCWLEDG